MKNDTLDVTTIKLLIEQYQAAQIFDLGWPFAEQPRIEVEKRVEYVGTLLMRMIQQVAVQRECIARYPANWWEAVKERFAPGWFLKRYPVQQRVIDMEVLYPRIAMPRQGHVIKLVQYDMSPNWSREYTS